MLAVIMSEGENARGTLLQTRGTAYALRILHRQAFVGEVHDVDALMADRAETMGARRPDPIRSLHHTPKTEGEKKSRLIKSVGFDYCDARCVAGTSNNRGVTTRCEVPHNRRLQVVRGRYGCRNDFRFLIAPPVVIRPE